MKNKNTLLVLGIAVLLVTVVGTTFAFFTAQNAGRETIGAEVNATTGDTSTFLVSGDLSFTADQETFSVTSGDKSTTATGRVIFRAGSENENGSDLCYRVKLNVNSNNFNYTNSNGYPELVLQAKYADVTSYTTVAPNLDITSNSLHESPYRIDSVEPVRYVTVPVASANNETGYVGRSSAISGYDVTINQHTLNIPHSKTDGGISYIYKIHAGAGETVEQDWIFKLNFINYEWDQAEVSNPNNNNNKTFDGQVVFETTTCPTETTPTYVYWNNNYIGGRNYTFSNGVATIISETGVFAATNMPNDETKTAPEGRTYASRELLANASSNFENNPRYIRTTLEEGLPAGHELCVWYNNHEFCIAPNYWVETGDGVDNNHQSEANGLATKAKLKADLETNLGITLYDSQEEATAAGASDYCSSNSYTIGCIFAGNFLGAAYNGLVGFPVGGKGILPDGSAIIY